MPKHRKGKGKATAALAVPSLDNRPRYRTPEVQASVPQLPTPEPTPAVKTGNRQVSVERKLAAKESSEIPPLVRIPEANVRMALERADLRKLVPSVHEEEEEEESARGEISDEYHNFCGPWVSKETRPGFLTVMMRRLWTNGAMIGGRGRGDEEDEGVGVADRCGFFAETYG